MTAVMPLKAGVWDSLFLVPKAERIELSKKIYKAKVMQLDTAEAMSALDELIKIARTNNHKELEVNTIIKKAEYHIDFFNRICPPVALNYYRQALELAEAYELKHYIARMNNGLGYMLVEVGEVKEGVTYLVKSFKLLEDIGFENYENIYLPLHRIAEVYFMFENYDKAFFYMQKAMVYSESDKETDHTLHNTMGKIWKGRHNYDSALYHFRKALQLARESSDSAAFLGFYVANIAITYAEKGDYETAKPLIEQAWQLNVKNGCHNCATRALLEGIRVDLAMNNLTDARSKKQELQEYIARYPITSDETMTAYYKHLARLYQLERQFATANLYLDSFVDLREKVIEQNGAVMLINQEAQLAAESYMTEKKLLEKENSRQRILRNSSWIISGLVLLLLSGMLYSLRMRQRRKQHILLLEKQRAEEQARNYRNKLTFFIEGIREKNRLIEQMQEKLEIQHPVSALNDAEKSKNVQLLEQLYDSIILTEEDWIEFKRLFEKVHPGFIQVLQHELPDLTASEIRFLVLARLNLAVPEIASMLGINIPSVRKTRWRLRKKLGFSNHKEMLALVNELQDTPYGGTGKQEEEAVFS